MFILWLVPAAAQAAPCTLMVVSKQTKADLVVYFTKFVEEDRTKGQFRKCRVVRAKNSDTRTYRVTPFRQDASVVVHRKNWPSS